MVHCWVRGILVDNFPFRRLNVERKGDRRRLRRFTVVPDPVEVIRIVGTPGEEDLVIFFLRPGSNAITGITWMCRQFGPFNFGWITFLDFSHPAFVRCDVVWVAHRILISAIYIHDRVSE